MKKEISFKVEKVSRRDIDNLYKVHHFIRDCFHQLHLNFHPDTPFEDYIDDRGNKVFTPAEAGRLSSSLDRCFEVCRRDDADIYGIAVQELNQPLVLKSKFKL